MGVRRIRRQKSALRENVEFAAMIYVASIVGFALVALGLDALKHFIDFAPYARFPWKELRYGIALGIAAPTVLFALSPILR